jgi:prolyl-tRNA synthetase
MRLSQLVGNRYKERPAEALLDSHVFLLRGGYARPVANGIYCLLPPGLRVVHKIERIVREEMDRIGGQEVLMPVVLPRELWEASGRYASVGSELVRFTDRAGHDMVLGMTHEEAVVALCRNEIKSHGQLPFMVYQVQTKFRDEPRSRGGLIRVREFTMKDGYSFHASEEDLERYYRICFRAYERVFTRVGLPEVIVVESDTGMMGGRVAHEFTLLSEAGEDTVAVCDSCSYRVNMDVARGRFPRYPEAPRPLEKVHTPGMKTIEEVAGFLGVEPRQTAKVVFYESDAEGRLVVLLIRGDLEVNEVKVAHIIGTVPVPAGPATIASVGAVAGFATVMGLDPRRCRVLVDQTIAESNNLVCGANEVDYHYRNFNLERDLPDIKTVDVARVQDGAGCPTCDGALRLRRGIEAGNIFQLGTRYTESMAMTFTDEEGKVRFPVMGCYGIGIGRLMSCIMEAHHDAYGPRWPMSVAPWHVHVCALTHGRESLRDNAEALYRDLRAADVEVLYDDRDATPGVQFADADLLGVPIRLVVSERNLQNGVVEYKRRDTGESGMIPAEAVITTVKQRIDAALQVLQSDLADECP